MCVCVLAKMRSQTNAHLKSVANGAVCNRPTAVTSSGESSLRQRRDQTVVVVVVSRRYVRKCECVLLCYVYQRFELLHATTLPPRCRQTHAHSGHEHKKIANFSSSIRVATDTTSRNWRAGFPLFFLRAMTTHKKCEYDLCDIGCASAPTHTHIVYRNAFTKFALLYSAQPAG